MLDNPDACTPRWCFAWRDGDGAKCDADDVSCRARPIDCEVADPGHHCAAGSYPDGDGSCRPGGSLVAQPDGGGPIPRGPPMVGDSSKCPPGFVASAADSTATCAPDPKDCGDDAWGGVQDGAGVVFVDPSAGVDGKGSRAQPYGNLASALAVVPADGTVALAAGTYSATIAPKAALKLVGRCAALVALVGQPPVSGGVAAPVVDVTDVPAPGLVLTDVRIVAAGAAIVVHNGHTTLRRVALQTPNGDGLTAIGGKTVVKIENVILSGPADAKLEAKDVAAVRVRDGARATLLRVRLDRPAGGAVLVRDGGSSLQGSQVAVLKRRPRSVWWPGTIEVIKGAQANVSGLLLQGNDGAGVYVHGPNSEAVIEDLLIKPPPDQAPAEGAGAGAAVADGGRLELRRAALYGSRGVGLRAMGSGSRLLATDVLVADTEAWAKTGFEGYGALVEGGAKMTLSRVRITRSRIAALAVAEPGSEVTATDLVCDHTRPHHNAHTLGHGVQVSSGGWATLRRARLLANHSDGLLALHADTRVDATDLLVEGTLPEPANGKFGGGVGAHIGARVVLRRAWLKGNRHIGLLASGEGAVLRADDVLVQGTEAGKGGEYGWGGHARIHGRLELVGTRITGNREWGLVAGAARMDVAGSTVADTRVQAKDATSGGGVGAIGRIIDGQLVQCDVRLVDSVLHNNRTAGLAFGFGRATVRRCRITGTRASAFDPLDTLPGPKAMADGVMAYTAAQLTMSHCLLHDNSRAGLLVGAGSTADVGASALSGSVWGVVTQDGGVAALDDTLLHDNSQANVAGDLGLAVPEPPAIVEASPP